MTEGPGFRCQSRPAVTAPDSRSYAQGQSRTWFGSVGEVGVGSVRLKLVADKAGATRLGFVVLLKFYEIEGSFKPVTHQP